MGDHFDPEQLRSFLAVAESLSFTRAAAALGRGQPTISQHVRKLEGAAGRALLLRDTRAVSLTADGEAMAVHARAILAAHQQAVEHFTGPRLSGRLRFGVTDDLALSPVPRILRSFRQQHPRVEVELTVSQSSTLQRRLESGHLDVAFCKQASNDSRGRLVRRDRLVWAAVPDARLEPGKPVPVVVYQAPSLSTSLGVQALRDAQRPFRVACTVRGVLGLVAAARAGLGWAIFARSLVPEDLVEAPASAGLPELGGVDLVLLAGARAATAPVEALAAAILASGAPRGPAAG